jgi:hypothetical protein
VVRIDPETNRIAASVPVEGDPYELAAGEGSVWVVGNSEEHGDVLHRIDPRINRVVATMAFPRDSTGPIAAGEGAVLLVLGDQAGIRLARIEPHGSRVEASVPLVRMPGYVDGIATGRDGVWVLTHSETVRERPGDVTQVDPKTNRVEAIVPAEALSLSAGPGGVWASGCVDCDEHRDTFAQEIHSDAGRPAGPRMAVRNVSFGPLFVGDEAVWFSGYARSSGTVIFRLDPESRAIEELLRVGDFLHSGVAFDADNAAIWIARAVPTSNGPRQSRHEHPLADRWHPRRRNFGGVGIPALTACVGLVVAAAGCTDARQSDVQAPAVRAAAPGWSKLRPPPVAQAWAVVLWTEDRLFLWGGERGGGANPYRAEGLLFDPGSCWERVAGGPLRPRLSAGAAWTGREALIWGGWAGEPLADGAAFDPQRRAWRGLPAAPPSAREPAVTVWTGRELVVWGDSSRSAEARDGAAYDPRSDRWRRLAPAPLALNQASATWTGTEMIVYGALLDENNLAKSAKHAQGMAYDPRADRWRAITPYELSPHASSVAWTGDGVLAWDYELRAGLYEPARDRWRPLPDLPLRFSECYPASARVGEIILAWYCGQAALLDVGSRSWRQLRTPESEIFGSPVSTGLGVLFPGASYDGRGNALYQYHPGPRASGDG